MTTVNVTLHSYPESPRSLEQMLNLIRDICDKRGSKYSLEEQTITYDDDIEEYLIKITLDNEEYSNLIDDLYECKNILDENDNLEDYDELFPYDFTVSVESGNIDPLFERVRYRSELLSDQRSIVITDSINDLYAGTIAQEKRLQAIEEYMKYSGIVYYKSFIEQLLNKLGELNLVDVELAKQEFFETKH